jgi:hypothetical protein
MRALSAAMNRNFKQDGHHMNSPQRILARFKRAFTAIESMHHRLDDIRINQGLILSKLNASQVSRDLQDHEFRVFSQWGEDGIIQFLINAVDIKHKTFIEFGVEDFSESNCRFLLVKDNWRGFVIDGSARNIKRLTRAPYFWRHDLKAVNAFITKDNINELLSQSEFDEDLGLLSVDIDGVDFHVLEAITAFKPRILVCEYNAVFGGSRPISVPYEPSFQRGLKHPSNLYFGASLAAMELAAQRKGYALVGTNRNGANAFFVRNDLMNDKLQAMTSQDCFTSSRFRESRGADGELTFIAGEERLALVKGMPVLNVKTGEMESL